MNRREQSTALRDVTGLGIDFAQALPGDGAVGGFDTGADAPQEASDAVAQWLQVTRRAVAGIHILEPAKGKVFAAKLRDVQAVKNLPPFGMLGDDGRTFPTPGPGFLGAEHQGLACPGNGLPPSDLPRAGDAEIAAQDRRERLRSQLSQPFHQGRPAELVESHDVAFARRSALMRRQASFDITREPSACAITLAHRPSARTCSSHAGCMQRHITAEFDHCVGALVDDLIDKGLWDHTLLVCMGEFGRTEDQHRFRIRHELLAKCCFVAFARPEQGAGEHDAHCFVLFDVQVAKIKPTQINKLVCAYH